MNLNELITAAMNLPVEERQELLLLLASSLRKDNQLPPAPRQFTLERMESWMAEDERDMQTINRRRATDN